MTFSFYRLISKIASGYYEFECPITDYPVLFSGATIFVNCFDNRTGVGVTGGGMFREWVISSESVIVNGSFDWRLIDPRLIIGGISEFAGAPIASVGTIPTGVLSGYSFYPLRADVPIKDKVVLTCRTIYGSVYTTALVMGDFYFAID